MNTKLFAAAALTLFAATAVSADELKPMHAGAYDLGEQTAVVYYIDTPEGYEVVTTVAPNVGREGSIMRHVATVAAGQNYEVSIAGSGSTAAVLKITRHGDSLEVATSGIQGYTVASR